jgi:hypothetical protein
VQSARITRELPPLILYPFNHSPEPEERCRIANSNPRTRRYLETRYNEFRMLCLIGKDLNRWLELCLEATSGDPELATVSESDFIAALLFTPPVPVLQKIRSWGVKNYQLIFSRSIGLNAVFQHPPAACDLSKSFLLGFHRYADALSDTRLKVEQPTAYRDNTFTFDIYGAGEYSSYLEKSWQE